MCGSWRDKPCVAWQGLMTSGYPVRFEAGKTISVARELWEAANGPLRRNQSLYRLCENPSCIELSHLEPRRAASHMTPPVREFCKNGHPLSGDNLAVSPDGTRRCRICRNAWAVRNHRQKKEGK